MLKHWLQFCLSRFPLTILLFVAVLPIMLFAPRMVSAQGGDGLFTDTSPTFSWFAVGNATDYQLLLKDSLNNTLIAHWYTAAAAGCASGRVCNITPFPAHPDLAEGDYKWWVRARNGAGTGPWSARMDFTVTAPDEEPVTQPDCTQTADYWSAHLANGEQVFLHGETYAHVLWRGGQGNHPWYVLGRAYIASYLNELNGADVPETVASSMGLAYRLLGSHTPDASLDATTQQTFLDVARILNSFNDGFTGPGACAVE